jgi:hypothetical protein
MRLNLCADPLPEADLIFTRDCLVHLSFADIAKAVANVKASGATWWLTTTFPGCTQNRDIFTGDWRKVNLQLPPFNFPPPERLISEQCTQPHGEDKSLGLWRVADL